MTPTALVCAHCGRDLRTPDHPHYSSEYQIRTLDDGTRAIVCPYGDCFTRPQLHLIDGGREAESDFNTEPETAA